MKRKCCILLFTILLAITIPLTAFAEETPNPSQTPSDTESPTVSPTGTPDVETPEPVAVSRQLAIDGETLYPGMDKTYENGYIPIVKDGSVSIVLPLLGDTLDGTVTLSADLGQTTDSRLCLGITPRPAGAGSPMCSC